MRAAQLCPIRSCNARTSPKALARKEGAFVRRRERRHYRCPWRPVWHDSQSRLLGHRFCAGIAGVSFQRKITESRQVGSHSGIFVDLVDIKVREGAEALVYHA